MQKWYNNSSNYRKTRRRCPAGKLFILMTIVKKQKRLDTSDYSCNNILNMKGNAGRETYKNTGNFIMKGKKM